VNIVVYDAGQRTADVPEVARTKNCKAVGESPGKLIVCNAVALYEAEAAIRSFNGRPAST
jgi:hypothetical protein